MHYSVGNLFCKKKKERKAQIHTKMCASGEIHTKTLANFHEDFYKKNSRDVEMWHLYLRLKKGEKLRRTRLVWSNPSLIAPHGAINEEQARDFLNKIKMRASGVEC